ncbi:MAG: UDP-N-acetylglucosamine 2-epimerase (hydrolyzing) [Oscillospiraceae bacterium]|nr:UDP-N-acetylglucosamine 2-epimerase (hydrolyzing) [Oscillospiraceae bacterium]
MRKVCIVITARASYSRIKGAMQAIQKSPDMQLQLVVAASAMLNRYGEAYKQMEDDGFIVDRKIYSVVEGENPVAMVKTTGLGMIELVTAFEDLKPDVVVTIADRYETIATAIAASYSNIPLAHIQGGEVTGNIDEKVRHAITKLADLHLVASEKAAERVIKMGENADRVFVTGCPSIDLAARAIMPELDFDPIERYGGSGEMRFKPEDYYIVIQHPVTDERGRARQQIEETLKAMNELGKPTYWIWPNADSGSDETSKGIRVFRERNHPKNIWFFRDIPSRDFLKLLYHSSGIVGNSSVAIRECSYLGVPAINIGSRQSGRDRAGNVTDVGYNKDEILAAIATRRSMPRVQSTLYGDGKAGERIAEILRSADLTYTKKLTY